MASRRKRGPVAFRPHLSVDLALSLLTTKCSRRMVSLPDSQLNLDIYERHECPQWVTSRPFTRYYPNGCFRE